MPERQAVFSARDSHKYAIVRAEHPLRLDRLRYLIVDEIIETELTKGGIMPWQLHDGFCFALRAVHTSGSYEQPGMNANVFTHMKAESVR